MQLLQTKFIDIIHGLRDVLEVEYFGLFYSRNTVREVHDIVLVVSAHHADFYLVAVSFVTSNLEVTNDRLNLLTCFEIGQIYIRRTCRILCRSGNLRCIVCCVDFVFSGASIHEDSLIRYAIRVVDDCTGASDNNSILSHYRCLHSYVVEASVVGHSLEHKEVGQTTIDILCTIDDALELHDTLFIAFVSDGAEVFVHEFVAIVAFYACFGIECQVHFDFAIFTRNAPLVFLWVDRAVVKSDVHF